MADEEQPHYTEFQEMREGLVQWGYTHLDDWFANERANCEQLLDWLQKELQGRQVEAIEHGFDGDEGHDDRITKLEDTITIVKKWIAEIGGQGNPETTATPMQGGQAPQGDAPQDDGGEQDMVVSDGE